MSRWRSVVVSLLFSVPVLLLVAFGAYALWETGRAVWLLWLFPLCWTAAWLLLRFRPRRKDATAGREPPPVHWTPTDRAAFELVRQEQQAISSIAVAELSNPHYYLQSALDLSLKIAQHYHPRSSDPVSSLTVVEVLAAAQLALEDMSDWMHHNVPGSHLLTIRHWRALSHAPRWIQVASDVSWLLTLLWNPLNLPRWLATRFATTSATQEIEASLLGAFYCEFLHNVGLYCIEMNSGRLRGGAGRNRAALERLRQRMHGAEREAPVADVTPPAGTSAPRAANQPNEAADARIALIGQVNAGKSSLINALLGENRARCGVLSTTSALEKFQYTLGQREHFELWDTPGYGSAELSPRQRQAIREAWGEADLVLLVMDVTSPARAADWRTFRDVVAWYEAESRLKPPRVIGVLTHIDGLAPVLEWQPPYDWNRPSRPKERSIRAAVEYAEQVFSGQLDAIIPVCTDGDRERVYGVTEWLLPAVVALLPEAKASLVVRTLHQDADAERLRQLVRQIQGAGAKLLGALLQYKLEPRP
ncbi:MAG: GTPase [Pirellulaceae bacterium]